MPAETAPTHVAGFTIQTPIEFGVFGRSYVGFHSQEGRRILKILRDGEELAGSDEEHGKLKEDPTLLHFEPRQQTQEGHRILIAHFFQAASMGILVKGSELQKGCDKTLRDLDPNNECASMLRNTTLQQKLELVRTVAQRLEKLEADKRSFPFVTPWNIMLADAQPKLVDLGLAYNPEKLDLDGIHEDVLAYYAPEVVKCLTDKKPVQVGPAAAVYALGLTARSILLGESIEIEGAGGGGPAPASPSSPAVPAAPGASAPATPAPSSGVPRRQAILAGKSWRRAPQEKISARLEGVLARAASPDPRRRPAIGGFVKEIEAILRDKEIAWTAPSKAPQLVGALVLAGAIVGGVAWAVWPDAAEKVARGKYAKATATSDRAEQTKLLKDAEATLEKSKLPVLPEIQKLEAIIALADVKTAPDAAVKALRDYANNKDAPDADKATARFIAAFIQKWGQLQFKESTDELKKVADSSPSDPAAKSLPTLAKIAQRLGPFGVEGADWKADEAKGWKEACVDALSTDGALVRSWPVPTGYEKIPDAKGTSYKAGWIVQLLVGRVKDVTGDESAKTDLKAGLDAFPCFASSAAYALCLAHGAKTPEDVTAAQAALDAASKAKGATQSFGEGTLASAYLLAKSATIAAQAPNGKSDPDKWRLVVKAYENVRTDRAVTPNLDLNPAADQGRIMARRELGIAIARSDGSGGNDKAFKEAELALQEVLSAFEKDKDFQDKLAPETHEALGLVLMADLQAQQRSVNEALNDLLYFYNDQDPKNGYRRTDDPRNADVSKAFFEIYKKQLTDLLQADKPDPQKHADLHAKLDALCKLEKFDTSFLPLADAQAHRKDADLYKPGDKRRLAELNAAKATFESVFNSSDTSWPDGLAGYIEATFAIAHETDDLQTAQKILGDAQTFMDKAADTLKGKKVAAKEIAKALDPQRALLRKEWFTLLGKWLDSHKDWLDAKVAEPKSIMSVTLGDNDPAFVQSVLNLAEGQNAPELDPASKAQVAQLHWILGVSEFGKSKWTEAVKDLQAAADGLADDQQQLRIKSANLAAQIAFTRPTDVTEPPWGTGKDGAKNWGRDKLAAILGRPAKANNFRQYADALRKGTISTVVDDETAQRLVDNILSDPNVSPDDQALATMIWPKSARAQLLLAKGYAATDAGKARDAAAKAVDLGDPQKDSDVIVDAANIYCDATPADEFTKGTGLEAFGKVLQKTLACYNDVAGKWRGTDRAADAYNPLYWNGRYLQATADLHAGSGQDARKEYSDAEDAYNRYRDELNKAQLGGKERADTQTNINTCHLLKTRAPK